jgi:hypothetical protein
MPSPLLPKIELPVISLPLPPLRTTPFKSLNAIVLPAPPEPPTVVSVAELLIEMP